MSFGSTPQTILIVEDEVINIQALAGTLSNQYQIKIATHGEQALKLIECHLPDLILLDVALPDISGYELCRKLKKDPRTKHIPVIFITAQSDVEDEAYGLSLGAVDYISKPYHMPIVMARVANHLSLKHKTDLLERMAAVDGLTDLFNRRRFDEALDQEWRRAQRDRLPLCVLLIDVDFFKDYNDCYGHGQGDQCLREVAAALAQSVHRSADLVARIGGEEFAFLLPNTELSGALHIAESVRRRIEALGIEHARSSAGGRVTVSIGIGSSQAEGLVSSAQLLQQADHYLYEAKRAGRNCVYPRA